MAIISPPSPLVPPYRLSTDFEVSSFTYDEDDDELLQKSLQANLSTIQQGFKVQQSCMSEIFFCYNQKTFDELIACLKHDQTEPQTSAVLCELCAVAIVAGQYVQDWIKPGLLDHWYGRIFL